MPFLTPQHAYIKVCANLTKMKFDNNIKISGDFANEEDGSEIISIIADSDFEDEYMPINIHHLREVLFNRLRDKQTKHIDKLIHSYNLRKKNMVKKSVLEKMLEEAVCL